ncbi:MAG TPA: hypothetical protein VFQ07_15520 [Candidatus Polarisedimenticolia bacterium]|nr:hypothetical protein [Candidatus Polarisedimenticolia bacterium]
MTALLLAAALASRPAAAAEAVSEHAAAGPPGGRPHAAEPPPSTPSGTAAASATTAAPEWEYAVVGNGYLFPGEGDFLLGIGTADRGALHLEARWNYEDRGTGSALAGWNFSGGEKVEWAVTPLFGVAAGDTDAVLGGVELSLGWKRLDYYFEGEVAYDLHDSADNFVYGWSELGYRPVDWLRVGLVGQRTRVVDTGLDVQRGLLAQGIAGRFTFGADWFNPGSDDEFVVAILEVSF